MSPRLPVAFRALAAPVHDGSAAGLTWADAGALVGVLCWGIGFPVTKSVMLEADPLTVSFLRQALASLVFAVALIPAGGWGWPTRQDLPRLVAVGLVGQAASVAFWALGLHATSASHSGLIYAAAPLLVFALAHFFGEARIRQRDLFGLTLGLLGAILIVVAPLLDGGLTNGATLGGDLLVAAGMVAWGLWNLGSRPLLRRHGTLRGTAWITAASTLGLLPLALPSLAAQDWSHLSAQAWTGLAYSGLISGALGGLLWYGAVRQLGAARTVMYANLESVFAVIAAAILLGERVEWTALVGGAVILAGVVLTRRRSEG